MSRPAAPPLIVHAINRLDYGGPWSGNGELVADGVTGTLYDPARARSLEAAILPYLVDPALRSRHGVAGLERVVQCSSLGTMIQRYLDPNEELLIAPGATPVGRQGQGAY